MLTIEWKNSALDDLDEILLYIRLRSPQGAERLYSRIVELLESTSKNPYMFKRSERMQGMREIVIYPSYVVLYQVSATAVEVVNVLHTSRHYPGREL